MNIKHYYWLILIVLFCGCSNPESVFNREVDELSEISECEYKQITNESISGLPAPVQNYFRIAGFVDVPESCITEIHWSESYIKLGPELSWRKLQTRHFNFTNSGSRLAYMKARMALVIPFEGRDRYHDGNGHMLGTVGRLIKVFDTRSREIALGGAVIVLAESLLEPTMALRDYITWEEVDDLTAKATFTDGDISVSGIFHFNEDGYFIRFESGDRPYEVSEGVYEVRPFSINLAEYHEAGGFRIPGKVYATWHLEDGDFNYWEGRISGLTRVTD